MVKHDWEEKTMTHRTSGVSMFRSFDGVLEILSRGAREEMR